MPGKRTMTIQTQTPGWETRYIPMKPPTLAELRKMAKRKGPLLVVKRFEGADTADGSTCVEVTIQGQIVVMAWGSRTEAHAMAFAALSALPDKERAR